MLDPLTKEQSSATMMKHFVLMNLIFPLMRSDVGADYSPDIVYANLFAVLFVYFAIRERNIEWKRKSWLGYSVAFLLVCFNIFSLYVNVSFYGWYAGQINMTIAFLLFLALLLIKDSASCRNDDMVRFLLKATAITNLLGLIPYFMGNMAVLVSDRGYDFQPLSPSDTCYSWLYDHKSQYSFFLVLFLALAVTYRRLFEKKWQFWGSVAIFAVCLVIADTRTTMVAALFIPIGVLADYLKGKVKRVSWKHLLWFVPFVVLAAGMFYVFSKERNIWTLNYRTYIWKAEIENILDNPWGVGAMAGLQGIEVENVPFPVYNCHNVFLNAMLQFSIPAGACYIAMIGAIIIASMKRNPSFLTLGTWVAMLIPMNMDWCVLLGQVPMMLLMMYFLFFSPGVKAVYPRME